jgi:myo-inositol-1(or 4)-monophosphatase
VTDQLRFYNLVQGVACEAAAAAAELIRNAAGSVEAEQIRSKGLHDLVTEVDENAERLIISIIRTSFPDHTFLAEESADGTAETAATNAVTSNAVTSNATAEDNLWIIDPIDGTTNFLHGVPPYAVSIAFRHKGELVVGVVHDVPHDEIFTAIAGCGLWINGERATVSHTPALSESLITTGFPYREYDHIDLYLNVLKRFMAEARGVRRPGSASVDLAWVACGRFDGFYETGLKPWDVAAGIVLVREGGGAISDYAGDPNPSFNAQIVASNKIIHPEVLRILEPMQGVFD